MAPFLPSALMFVMAATSAGTASPYVNEVGLRAATYHATCLTYPKIPVFIGQPQFFTPDGKTGTVSDIHWVSAQGLGTIAVGYFLATLEDHMTYFYPTNPAIFTVSIGSEPLDIGEVDDTTLTEVLYRTSLVKTKNLTFFIHDCFSWPWDGATP